MFTILLLVICNLSLKSQYEAYGWGSSEFGQLGIGIATQIPNQTVEGTDWKEISCGGYCTAPAETRQKAKIISIFKA